MRVPALALVLFLPLLSGCFHGLGPGSTDPGTSEAPIPGRHLALVLLSSDLAEGVEASLRFRNAGTETLAGTLTIELLDPRGAVIGSTPQAIDPLGPRGALDFRWRIPSRVEPGVYTWRGTLDGATASATATVAGTAGPGAGPLPVGTSARLEVGTDRALYLRADNVNVTLRNNGTAPLRGEATITIRGPTDSVPGDPSALPAVASLVVADLALDPGASRTVGPLKLPLAGVPAGRPQYLVLVRWAHGDSLTNLFVENATRKPAPLRGALEKTWADAPTPVGWSGKETFSLDASRTATLYWAEAGEPGPTSTAAYRNAIKTALATSWAFYKGQGWKTPDMPIHVYVDNPGGVALGTMRPTEYGARIVVGPEMLHTDANVRSTAAHELFHAFQTMYDFDEGLIVEGFATWMMDLPFPGSKDYLGQARAFLNNPDEKQLHYQEHEFAIFLRHLADTRGFAKMQELAVASADYDGEFLFQKVFGSSLATLWGEFLTALAKRDVANADELFDKPGVFGLKAWEWRWGGATETLAAEKSGRTLRLPVSNFDPASVDEDVGQVRHAFGFDAYRLMADANFPAGPTDAKVTFTSADPETTFLLRLATRPKAGGAWTVTNLQPDVPVTIPSLSRDGSSTGTDAYLFVSRGGDGKGTYDVRVER